MQVTGKLLLKPSDLNPTFPEWIVEGVLNPAGIRLQDKKIVLLVRVAESGLHRIGNKIAWPIMERNKTIYEKISSKDIIGEQDNTVHLKSGIWRLKTISHFRKILLDETGFNVEQIFQKPLFTGNSKEGQHGVEDPRITKFKNNYLMTYVTVSHNEGVCTSLAVSKDLHLWQRKGIIFREQNKDVVLFPEKIKGEFVALHRPEGWFEFSRPSIWISHSKDLVYWGKEKSIVQPREKSWETDRIGAGTVPLKTSQGWLVLYHGVKKTDMGRIYSAGALLLDLKNPEKVLARTPKNIPLLEPKKDFEKQGFISNVVFPTVAIMDLNGKDLLIYSGGADSVTTVRKIALKDVFNSMEYY
ncbi:MAG: hypothetical protein JW772_04910 [Candidatus Diapherotrites archaeon]|nr:hypothetical protein [Candidatus Diapherotrites archaeon]